MEKQESNRETDKPKYIIISLAQLVLSIPTCKVGRVIGSNPIVPTLKIKALQKCEAFFYFCCTMYYFYIIFSKNLNRYYIGHSKDPLKRLTKHNTNHKGWTGKTNDWEIIYTEEFKTKSNAYARERQVKRWKSRKAIERLISQNK